MGMMINRRRVAKKLGDNFDIVSVIPKIIPNTYIDDNTGIEIPYNGWCSTDFIPVTDFSSFSFAVTNTEILYSAFYDESKNKIGKPGKAGDIPVNAKYVRFSHSGSNAYSLFMLAKNKMVANVYKSNKYIETNGAILNFSGWSVYKFAISNEAYVCADSFNEYTASYNSDNSVFDSGKKFIHKPTDGYVLASRNSVNSVTFYYGYNYGVIDYSQQ